VHSVRHSAYSGILSETKKSIHGCDSAYVSTPIVVYSPPTLTASNDTTICSGTDAILTANSNASVQWTGFPAGNNPITVSPDNNSTYKVIATSNNGCEDSISVNVSIQEFSFNLTANPNPVEKGSTFTLQTSSTTLYTVTSWWSSLNDVTDQTALFQHIIADTSALYRVTAISSIGCPATEEVNVIVIPPYAKDLFIPNAFTPNGDGKNDIFKVYSSYMKALELRVFNQWGNMIFESYDMNKGWDGTHNGKMQPTGVYVYTAKVTFDGNHIVYRTGSINLVR